MIEIINVTKEIKGKIVLKDINLNLPLNQMILLKGHNGSGKTMLLRLIAGFIKASSGEVKGLDKYKYGVIIENPSFFRQETALYNLKYLASINKIINEDDIINTLKQFDLYEVRNNKVKTFSLGMIQRLALCQAFMENPDVLLLDEPFNAIDENNLKILSGHLERFRDEGKLIIIASHVDTGFFNYDTVLKMNNGEITIG